MEAKELEEKLKKLKQRQEKEIKILNELFLEEKELVEDFKNNKGTDIKKEKYIEISSKATAMEKDLFNLKEEINLVISQLNSLYQNNM